MVAIAFILKYWREIALGLLILFVIGTGLYVRSVFAERNQLKLDKASLTFQLRESAALQEMTNQISEAIGQIKIRSQVNVSRIESQPKPVFVDSRPLPFITGGVLQAVPAADTAGGTTPGPAPGEPLPAGKPTGGILPR